VLPSAIGMPTLAQFRFSGLAIASAEIQIKYAEAILSNSTRKLLRFEIIRMLVAFKKNKFICVVYYTIVCLFYFPRAEGVKLSFTERRKRAGADNRVRQVVFIYLFICLFCWCR